LKRLPQLNLIKGATMDNLTKGAYSAAGSGWIVYVPLVGDVYELVEYVGDMIIARILARHYNRKQLELR
jgi:hypothetical protein